MCSRPENPLDVAVSESWKGDKKHENLGLENLDNWIFVTIIYVDTSTLRHHKYISPNLCAKMLLFPNPAAILLPRFC